MTAREQFLTDLATWILYLVVAYAVARFAVGAVRAVATEWRWQARQRRRTAIVLRDPLRYCLAGHLHDTRGEAFHCEAAHGFGETRP